MSDISGTLDADDITYVKAHFVPLSLLSQAYGWNAEQLNEALERQQIPAPTYILPNGTAMVPPDYFGLVGTPDDVTSLRERFMTRLKRAAIYLGLAHCIVYEEEWDGYMGGGFGACLKEVSPEAIVTKASCIKRISELLEASGSDSVKWREELQGAVNALDSLERPFAKVDRQRFGATSRDRFIISVRKEYSLDPR